MNGIDNHYRIRPIEQQESHGRFFSYGGWALLLFILAVLFGAEEQYAAQAGSGKEELLVSTRAEQGENGMSWVISLDGTAIGEVRGLEFILAPAENARGEEQSFWLTALPGQELQQAEAGEQESVRLRVTLSRIFLSDGSSRLPEQRPRGLLGRLYDWIHRAVFGNK